MIVVVGEQFVMETDFKEGLNILFSYAQLLSALMKAMIHEAICCSHKGSTIYLSICGTLTMTIGSSYTHILKCFSAFNPSNLEAPPSKYFETIKSEFQRHIPFLLFGTAQ